MLGRYADMEPMWYHGGIGGRYWAEFGGKFGAKSEKKKKKTKAPASEVDKVEVEYTRYLVKDDGQKEGGFTLSTIRALPQSREGWIVTYSTINAVDEMTGELLDAASAISLTVSSFV